MFWEQAGFFVVIQGAVFAVAAKSLPSGKQQWASLLVLSLLGLILALFWGWVACNRYWIIKLWNRQVRHLDRELDRC
jgi:hypothetical protein